MNRTFVATFVAGTQATSNWPTTTVMWTPSAEPTEQPDPGDTIPDVPNDDADTEPQE